MSHKPVPNKSVTLSIDGQSVTVPEGTTILEAAKKVNIHIPVLCDHPDLCTRALCRICVVEADGRGKLIAACANDVWEGVNIVTASNRLFDVRKTILELILANHPEDCLSCVKNKKCELQSLSAQFGIRESSFKNKEKNKTYENPVIEERILERNMSKCVMCTRCVEACQQVQTVRAINTCGRSGDFAVSAPYNKTFSDGGCVFCGQCADVCPVGAICGHDQSEQVLASLQKSSHKIAQVSPSFASSLDCEFGGSGNITIGKIITALKLLDFNSVFDFAIAYNASKREYGKKLKSKQPLITGCSKSVSLFIKQFYPDLLEYFDDSASAQDIFTDEVKKTYPDALTVSFVSSIARKHNGSDSEKKIFTLTAAELARLIRLAGIDIASLREENFDVPSFWKGGIDDENIEEPAIICGFAEARKVLEDIRNKKCGTKWIHIYTGGRDE